jgi:hypothetical protein
MPENTADKKLPPLFIIKATLGLRNFLVRITKKMLPANFILLEEASAYWKSKCLEVAAKLNIPDHLANGPMTIKELALLAEAHEESLYRMLRALAGEGIFKELSGKRFQNTRLSKVLMSKKESIRYYVLHHLGNNNWDLVGDLYNSIKTGENAIQHKFHMDPFEFLAQNPDKNDIFNKAMTETAEMSGSIFVNSYDFGKYNLIIDIGGGQGHLLSQIMSRYENIKGILFDQPHVVSEATQMMQKNKVDDRCSIVSGSFFEDIPINGDLYLMKNILHDWDDSTSVIILSNIHKAMPENSRLLIIETIIKPDNKPSFGKFIDLQMLIGTIGGKERTLPEYKMLLNDAGFKINRIIENATPFSFIEVVKA